MAAQLVRERRGGEEEAGNSQGEGGESSVSCRRKKDEDLQPRNRKGRHAFFTSARKEGGRMGKREEAKGLSTPLALEREKKKERTTPGLRKEEKPSHSIYLGFVPGKKRSRR